MAIKKIYSRIDFSYQIEYFQFKNLRIADLCFGKNCTIDCTALPVVTRLLPQNCGRSISYCIALPIRFVRICYCVSIHS